MSAQTVHVYTRPHQPATRYWVGFDEHDGIWIKHAARRCVPCTRCRRMRWASRCTVQVYYDAIYYFCRDRECKKRRNR